MRFGLFFISLIFTLAAVACGQNPVQTNRHVASAADAATPTSTPLISPIPSPSPVTPPSELTIVVVPVEGKVGETVSMDVVMYNSSNGVAGFAIDAFVVDTDIAQIVDVELPKYGLTRIGDLPAPSVEIAVADLMGLLAGASPQRVIATLNP